MPEEWKDSLKASELAENREQLQKLVAIDSLISGAARRRILDIVDGMKDPDKAEKKMAAMQEYRY